MLERCLDILGNLPNTHLKLEKMTLGFLGTGCFAQSIYYSDLSFCVGRHITTAGTTPNSSLLFEMPGCLD